MKTKKYQFKPSGSALDPKGIETETVQYWRNGIMMTGMMRKETAIDLVNKGAAFVMCDQAIGAMDENGYSLA